ncbi:MAG: FAD-dependent oxidoreductase [Microthrixaceae bacterium]|nr:FAD-dependent oxidoreductase [Microthrixaceae bacterium]
MAVVGAGLSGLAAARHLQDRGRHPVVFEATGRVGGRQRSSELGGTIVEEGAVFFGKQYPNLWRRIRAAGLEGELKTYHAMRMRTLEAQRAGTTCRPRSRVTTTQLAALRRVLPRREKVKLVQMTAEILPRGGELRAMLGNEVSSKWLRRLDAVPAAHWLEAKVGPRFTESFASPIMESLSFADASEWSALGALMLMTFSATPRLHAIVGGNDRIAAAIAEPLEVRTGTSITAISPDPGGVGVEADDGSRSFTSRFNDVVVAVPGPVAASLLHGELAEVVSCIRYSSSVVPAIVTDSPLDVPAVSFYEADSSNHISGLAVERPCADGPILCFANVRSPLREELIDADDDRALDVLSDTVERATGVRPIPKASKVIRWRHSIPVGEPGMLQHQARIRGLVGGVPHLELAGDYLVSPSQEGALVSGARAAAALIERG